MNEPKKVLVIGGGGGPKFIKKEWETQKGAPPGEGSYEIITIAIPEPGINVEGTKTTLKQENPDLVFVNNSLEQLFGSPRTDESVIEGISSLFQGKIGLYSNYGYLSEREIERAFKRGADFSFEQLLERIPEMGRILDAVSQNRDYPGVRYRCPIFERAT